MTKLTFDTLSLDMITSALDDAATRTRADLWQLQMIVNRLLLTPPSLWQPSPEDALTALTRVKMAERSERLVTVLENVATQSEMLRDGFGAIATFTARAEATLIELFETLHLRPQSVLNLPLTAMFLRMFTAAADAPWLLLPWNQGQVLNEAVGAERGPDKSAAFVAAFFTSLRTQHRVTVKALEPASVRAPKTLAELAQRVPASTAGEPQVRVERYQHSGAAHWIVYSAGTVSFAPNAKSEPFDLSSNLDLVAKQEADSLRAVQTVMLEAGVRDEDHVLFVGFSQGGILAAELSSSREEGTADLVAFGAPIAQVDLDRVDGVVAVEHQDDVVPALGGFGPNSDRVVVSARAFDRTPLTGVAAAHDLSLYERTITAAEQAASAELAAEKQKILRSFRGEGVGTLWRADRSD